MKFIFETRGRSVLGGRNGATLAGLLKRGLNTVVYTIEQAECLPRSYPTQDDPEDAPCDNRTATPSSAQISVEGGEAVVLNEQVRPEEDGTQVCGVGAPQRGAGQLRRRLRSPRFRRRPQGRGAGQAQSDPKRDIGQRKSLSADRWLSPRPMNAIPSGPRSQQPPGSTRRRR